MKKFFILSLVLFGGCYEQFSQTIDNPYVPDEYSYTVYVGNSDGSETEQTGSYKKPYNSLCNALEHFYDPDKFNDGSKTKTIIFKKGTYEYTAEDSNCWDFNSINELKVLGEDKEETIIKVDFYQDNNFANINNKKISFEGLKFISNINNCSGNFFDITQNSILKFNNILIEANINSSTSNHSKIFRLTDSNLTLENVTATININISVATDNSFLYSSGDNLFLTFTNLDVTLNNLANTFTLLKTDLTNSAVIIENFSFNNKENGNLVISSIKIFESNVSQNSTFNLINSPNIKNNNSKALTSLIFNVSSSSTLKVENVVTNKVSLVASATADPQRITINNNKFIDSELSTIHKITYSYVTDGIELTNNFIECNKIDLFYSDQDTSTIINLENNKIQGQLVLTGSVGLNSKSPDFMLKNNNIFLEEEYSENPALKHTLFKDFYSTNLIHKLIQINCDNTNTNKFCNLDTSIISIESCINNSPPNLTFEKVAEKDFTCGNYTYTKSVE